MLETLRPALPDVPLTDEANEWVALARARLVQHDEQHGSVGALIETEPASVWRVLTWLLASDQLPGSTFLEWGSGVGLVAGLASLAGLDVYGIELAGSLVEAANDIARQRQLSARFVAGSFVTPELEAELRVSGTYGATRWEASDEDPYRALGLDLSQVDIIFAYPWPRELLIFQRMFELCAKPGAVLWLNSDAGPLLSRKTA